VWEDTGFPKVTHSNWRAADGRVRVMLAIAEEIGDSEEKRVDLFPISWMHALQLAFSSWGRVGDRHSQIALPLAGVWMNRLVNCEAVSVGVVWVHGCNVE